VAAGIASKGDAPAIVRNSGEISKASVAGAAPGASEEQVKWNTRLAGLKTVHWGLPFPDI